MKSALQSLESRIESHRKAGELSARAEARQRADGVDELLTELFKKVAAAHGGRSGIAVIATGGYGRAALSPHSDIDLLLLIADPDDERVKAIVEAMLYPLWDSGLTVGHAVRTIDECIEIGRKDHTVRSAMLDMRLIVGDRALYRTAAKRLERKLFGVDKTGFVRFKLEEIAARRERSGDAAFRNEPDLKEGEGGLRDAQTAIWIGRTVWQAKSPSALSSQGIVTSQQVSEWNEAKEHLLAVRAFLHRAAGRKVDRLSFERQAEAAEYFGYRSSESGHAAEHFMRDLLIHQAAIQRFLADVVDQLPRRYRERSERAKPRRRRRRALPEGFKMDSGRLRFASRRKLKSRPQDLVRIFAVSATHDVPIHPKARQAIRANLDAVGPDTQRDPEAAEAFVTLLTHANNGASRLAAMNVLGLLGRFVPEFEANYCRMQYDKYHVFTVDAHSIQAVKELHQLFAGKRAESQPLLSDVVEDVEPLPVVLGTFLHDVGKGAGRGHVAAGARMVPVICERLGIESGQADLVLFMELEHLLMSHVAQRRDLADPKTITDFAEKVGTLERLRALYLMTYADIRAVGPSTWSEWKGSLLRELYVKTRAVLSAAEVDTAAAELESRAQTHRDAARVLLLDRVSDSEAAAFLDRFDARYFAATDPATVASDYALLQKPLSTAVRVQACVKPTEQLTELAFYSKDRPRLFADLTGVLAAAGMSIRSARIHTTRDGYALDRFEVTIDDAPVADLRRLDRLARTAEDVLGGEREIRELLRRSRPRWGSSGTKSPRSRPPSVEIHNDASTDSTVIDLVSADRLGLLHDVTRTLADHEVDIDVAIVSTKVDQAADTFYVTRLGGGKLDAQSADRIRDALLAVVLD